MKQQTKNPLIGKALAYIYFILHTFFSKNIMLLKVWLISLGNFKKERGKEGKK